SPAGQPRRFIRNSAANRIRNPLKQCPSHQNEGLFNSLLGFKTEGFMRCAFQIDGVSMELLKDLSGLVFDREINSTSPSTAIFPRFPRNRMTAQGRVQLGLVAANASRRRWIASAVADDIGFDGHIGQLGPPRVRSKRTADPTVRQQFFPT
ncbi:hypothetical protein, partial [Burkholderia ubonensis]|uniref:hypothetical protein n=1 Tax=Burkholderia ubonensis TaxID=101571 RepID=UPI001C43458D